MSFTRNQIQGLRCACDFLQRAGWNNLQYSCEVLYCPFPCQKQLFPTISVSLSSVVRQGRLVSNIIPLSIIMKTVIVDMSS